MTLAMLVTGSTAPPSCQISHIILHAENTTVIYIRPIGAIEDKITK